MTGVMATVVLVRSLGLSELGRYSVISLTLVLVFAATDLGVGEALIRRANVQHARSESLTAVTAEMSCWGALRLPLHVVVAAVVLHASHEAVMLVTIGQLEGVMTAGVALELLGAGEFLVLAKLRLLQAVVVPLALVLTSVLTRRAELVFAVPYAVQQTCFLLLLRRRPLRACLRMRRPRLSLVELRFGAAVYLNTQLSALTTSRSEVFFFPPQQAVARGAYAAVQTIASRATLAIDALFGTLPSTLAIAHSSGPDRYRRAVTLSLRYCCALLTFAGCPVVVAGQIVAVPLLGLPSTTTVELVTYMLISVSILVTALQPLFAMRFAEGSAGILLGTSALALCLNLLLSWILVPPLGLVGAATANASGSLITVAFIAGQALRRPALRAPVARLLAGVLGSCLAGGAILLFLELLRPDQPVPRIAASALAFVLSVAAGALLQRAIAPLEPEQLQAVTQTLRPRVLARVATLAIGESAPPFDR